MVEQFRVEWGSDAAMAPPWRLPFFIDFLKTSGHKWGELLRHSHKSIETTQTYLHAHLALKEAALAKLTPYERSTRPRFVCSPSSRRCKKTHYPE